MASKSSSLVVASKSSNAAESDTAKVAALTEEVHTLRSKLKEAARGQQELTEQLVPIERLKAQMRKEKKLKEEAEHQIEVMEMEKRKLNDEVNRLVRDLVFQKGETMKFENRSLDLEKLVVQLGQSERGAQGELLRAQEREQLSRVDAFNSGIAKRSAEEERDEALARAHSKEQQLKALKAEWSVLSHHHEKLQEELVERRVEVNALTKDQVFNMMTSVLGGFALEHIPFGSQDNQVVDLLVDTGGMVDSTNFWTEEFYARHVRGAWAKDFGNDKKAWVTTQHGVGRISLAQLLCFCTDPQHTAFLKGQLSRETFNLFSEIGRLLDDAVNLMSRDARDLDYKALACKNQKTVSRSVKTVWVETVANSLWTSRDSCQWTSDQVLFVYLFD
eukprot:s756_g9.t1